MYSEFPKCDIRMDMDTEGTTPDNLLRVESAYVGCRYCGKTGPTVTEPQTGTLTYLSSILVCFSGCSLGCCLLPFCMDVCRDVVHRCSTCRQVLGVYKRVGRVEL